MAKKSDEVPGASEEKRISAELDAMIRLHKLSTLSVTEGDLERILCEIVDTAIALTGADFGNIQLVDPVSLALRIVAQRGFPQPWVDFWNDLPEGRGSCGVSLKHGERVIVENVEQTPIFGGATLEMLLKAGVRAVQSTPLVSRSGKPLGMFSTHYRKPQRPDEDTLRLLDLLARQAGDIIEHVQGIAMLRESEERLRLAMSSGTIGFWDWDVINGRLTWSPELCEIYGVEAGAAQTYEDFSSRVHPDDLAAAESERDAAIRNHNQFDVDFRIIRPSGEIRWVSARGKGYYDENGCLVRVVGNNFDITERIRAKEAMREREERLRLALNASGAGSWMRDARTGRVDWGELFRELYGFTVEEPASFEKWLSRVHEEDRRQVLELWDQIVHRKAHDTFDSTFRIVRPNGTVSWIQSLGQVHRFADGQAMRLTGIELDVTERRRTEEALREREEREAFLLRLADTLRPLSDPLAMQEVTAGLLGEHLHVNRVTYADIEGTDYIVRLSHANGVAPLAGRGSLALFGQWVLEYVRSGGPHVVNDVRTDPRFTESERARLQVAEDAAFAGVMLVTAAPRVADLA